MKVIRFLSNIPFSFYNRLKTQERSGNCVMMSLWCALSWNKVKYQDGNIHMFCSEKFSLLYAKNQLNRFGWEYLTHTHTQTLIHLQYILIICLFLYWRIIEEEKNVVSLWWAPAEHSADSLSGYVGSYCICSASASIGLVVLETRFGTLKLDSSTFARTRILLHHQS